jgi:hypothetical protein
MRFDVGAFGLAVALGATVQYFADRSNGRTRRHRLRDKLAAMWRHAELGIERGARDIAHRAHGTAAELRGAVRRGLADDDVVAGRVRARLGRSVSHASAIETAVRDGCVVVSGPILAMEVEPCLSAIASVPGVRRVENQLDVHASPESVPRLQGPGRRLGARPQLLQENWAPGPRLIVGTAGGLMAAYGAARKGPLGAALGLMGAASLARAAMNAPIKRLIGQGVGRTRPKPPDDATRTNVH